MKPFLYFLSLVFVFFSCNLKEKEAQVTNITLKSNSASIVSADNQFGFELFKQINASLDEPKNTMISPISISLALAMLYNGADGNTKVQMEKVLHKKGFTYEDLNQSYKNLMDELVNHDSKVELSIANAIYYHNTFDIKKSFIATNRNYYQAEVDGLDFSNEEKTLKTVNGWVNNHTKGKIDKIIEVISPETVICLLNAIYFNGEWKNSFNPDNTVDMPFNKEDNLVINVPTMKIWESFNYFSNDDFEMLEMPYGGGKYSMIIFLPQAGKTTNDMISLFSSNSVKSWLGSRIQLNKEVWLPKFEFKSDNSLVDDLNALGMTDAFINTLANLKGISEKARLKVSEIKHKAYIQLNEKGTKAAAVTGIEVTTLSAVSIEPDKPFKVDHPFVFVIREEDTQAILFIGKVMNPLQN